MQINWWTLGLQAVNVLILVWLLARFLFKPVLAIAERRRAETAAQLEAASAARAAADADLARARDQNAHLASAREEALREVHADAERVRAALLERTRAETDTLRDMGRAELEQQRQQDQRQLAAQAGQLAVDIAERMLQRMPAPAPQQFLAGLVTALHTLPPATRDEIGAEGPVTLRAARELDAGELESCRQALATALGRPVDVQVQVERELIAGLEIRTPHAVVCNHFRADLERIAAALVRDGVIPP